MSKEAKDNLEENIENNENTKETNEEVKEETITNNEEQNKKKDETDEEIDELRELVIAKGNEAKENLDKYMRTMAEYDNFRKRTIKEKSDMYDKGIMESTGKFLDVLDNFNRAMGQLNTENLSDNEKNFYDGLVMVKNQFDQIFSSLGVKEIEAVGKEFDPNLHNAIAHTEDESLGENIVAEEFQKGYTYNDKVIRYSQVRVVN